MCGICGVYSLNMGYKEHTLFRHLLYINSLRGEDSTGVVKVVPKPEKKGYYVEHVKSLKPSWSFLREKKLQDFLADRSTVLLLGHCRAATLGSVTLKNAHPFSMEHVIGVHNGTVRKKFKNDDKYETDSEGIYKLINDYGIEAALKEIAGTSSAYVLAWLDKSQATMNFIKNPDRPLTFTFIDDRKTLLWSSDRGHLEEVMEYNKQKPIGRNGETDDINKQYWTLFSHDLLSFKIGADPTTNTIEHIDVPTYGTYSVSQTKTQTKTSVGEYAGYDDWYKEMLAGREGKNSPFADEDEDDQDLGDGWKMNSRGHIYRTYKTASTSSNPFGPRKGVKKKGQNPIQFKPVPFEFTAPKNTRELDYKLSKGCACGCGTVISRKDKSALAEVYWYDRSHYFAPDCVKTPFVEAIIEGDI